MPLMIEPLVMKDNAVAGGGYMVDGDTDKIMTLVRQARELGADLIKADPTDNVEDHQGTRSPAMPLLGTRRGTMTTAPCWSGQRQCSPRALAASCTAVTWCSTKTVRNHPGADGGAPRYGADDVAALAGSAVTKIATWPSWAAD